MIFFVKIIDEKFGYFADSSYLCSMSKDQKIAEQQSFISTLQRTIEDLNKTVAMLRQMLDALTKERETDRKMIETLQATVAELRAALSSKADAQEALAKSNRQLAAMVKNANKQNERQNVSEDTSKECHKPQPVKRRDYAASCKHEEWVDVYPEGYAPDDEGVRDTGLCDECIRFCMVRGYIKCVHYKLHKMSKDGNIRQAKAPVAPIFNSEFDASVIAFILNLRFAFSLPFERILKQIHQMDFILSKTTCFNLVKGAYSLIEPLGPVLLRAILDTKYLGMDETYYKLINCVEKNAKGKKVRKIYFWELYADTLGLVYYGFAHGSRSEEAGAGFLQDFIGFLQSDAYTFYKKLEKDPDNGIIRLSCIQHTKRNFLDLAFEIAQEIARLYGMLHHKEHEHTIGVDGWTEQQHLEWRQEYSTPILDEIEAKCKLIVQTTPPKTDICKAANYALNEMEATRNIFRTATCSLDNNACERLNRPFSLSRRNSLFFCSEDGAKQAALFYSLVSSCQLHGINAEKYLEWLFNTMARMSPKALKDQNKLRNLLPDMYATMA